METALSEAAHKIADDDDDNFDDLNDAYESGANIHGDQSPDPPMRFASIKFFLLYCTLPTYILTLPKIHTFCSKLSIFLISDYF